MGKMGYLAKDWSSATRNAIAATEAVLQAMRVRSVEFINHCLPTCVPLGDFTRMTFCKELMALMSRFMSVHLSDLYPVSK